MTLIILSLVLLFFLNRSKSRPLDAPTDSERSIAVEVDTKYFTFALAFSRIYNVDHRTILAIIAVESSGNPQAIGSAGEIGLMQLFVEKGSLEDANKYIQEVNDPSITIVPTDLYTPAKNIHAGTAYFAFLKHRIFSGSEELAIRAYNAGPGTILEDSEKGSTYLTRVLSFKRLFK